VSLINRAAAPAPGPASDAPGLEGDVDRAVAYAGPFLAGLVAKSAPTTAVLRALADELTRAGTGGRGVAHPELLDADAYWQKSAWPQAAAIVKHARRVLIELADELESPVRGSEQVIEQWLVADVRETAVARERDAGAARDAAIDAIAVRCEAVHRTVERLLTVVPPATAVETARSELDQAIARQAIEDVKRSRDDVAAAHAELDRAAFKDMWAQTYDARVAQRSIELRAEIPFRHQELLVTAFELALEAIGQDVKAMVAELTEPILGIGERLVRRYDEIVVDANALWSDRGHTVSGVEGFDL
jgi:hypothetical protein